MTWNDFAVPNKMFEVQAAGKRREKFKSLSCQGNSEAVGLCQ